LTYISLVLAVLAAVVAIFLLKRGGKPADAPLRRPADGHSADRSLVAQPVAAPVPRLAPLPQVPEAVPATKPALRSIVRTVNPHVEAMLKDFTFTRSADLPRDEAKAVVEMLSRIPRPPAHCTNWFPPLFWQQPTPLN